jgi:hypothetical protein
MMLICHDEAALKAASQKELGAQYGAFNEALAKVAGSATGERLQPSSAGPPCASTTASCRCPNVVRGGVLAYPTASALLPLRTRIAAHPIHENSSQPIERSRRSA